MLSSCYLPRTSILLWNQGFCCSWAVRRRFPKLQVLVSNIRDEVFRHHEKSMVWTSNLAQQFLVTAILCLIGVDVRIIHADFSTHEFQEWHDVFTSDPGNYFVLVPSFFINSTGSNLQTLCRNWHLLICQHPSLSWPRILAVSTALVSSV